MQPNTIEVDLASSMRRYRPSSLRLPTKILFGQWHGEQFRISLVHRTKEQIVHLKHVDWKWESNAGHEFGLRIKKWMHEEGVRTQRLVLSIPRRWTVLKTLTIPSAVQTELAEVIALQGQTLFPVQSHTLEMDFLPLPNLEDDGQRRVLVAATPREQIDQLDIMARSAGLKIACIGVGELCLPFLSKKTLDTAHRLNILLDGNSVEFLLSQNQFPLISFQTTQPTSPSELANLVRSTTDRMWQTLHAGNAPSTSSLSLHLFGQLAKEDYKHLADTIPESMVWESNQDSGAIKCEAVLESTQEYLWSLDFHRPRKPRNRQRDQRIRNGLIAVAAAILLILAAIPIYRDHQRLDEEIARARKQRMELDAHVARLKPLEKSWKKLVRFDRNQYNFAAETQRFMENMPPSSDMFLESLEISEGQSGLVSIQTSGKARSHETMAMMTNRLLQAEHGYRPKPASTTPTLGDGEYGISFTWEIELPTIDSERRE